MDLSAVGTRIRTPRRPSSLLHPIADSLQDFKLSTQQLRALGSLLLSNRKKSLKCIIGKKARTVLLCRADHIL